MKKLFIFIIPIMAIFGACQKDTVSFNCEISPLRSNSKVYLSTNDYGTFQEHDLINVNGTLYSISVSGGRYMLNNIDYSSNGYKAIYPTTDNTTSYINLPKNQVYTTVPDGTGAGRPRIIAPMAAQTSGSGNLTFYNLCSLLEVVIKAPVDNFTVRKIIVRSTRDPLWGTFALDWTSTPKLTTPGSNSDDSNRTATLTCDYTFATRNTTQRFYVIVPPFESAQSLSVAIDAFAPNLTDPQYNIDYYSVRNSSSDNTLAPSLIVTVSEPTNYTITPGHWDPYEIYSYEDLLFAAHVINNNITDNISGYRNGYKFRTGTFKIMNDIDCGNNTVIPLGSSTNFAGTIEGNNHTVTYNRIADPCGDIGLIGRCSRRVKIQNLTVAGNITIDHIYGKQVNVIGGICGGINGDESFTDTVSRDTAFIINCHNKANINSAIHTEGTIGFDANKAAHAGGIVGSVWGTNPAKAVIRNCTNSGNIFGIQTTVANSGTGGIIGQHISSISLTVDNCVNTGTITSTAIKNNSTCGAGGIIGVMHTTGDTPPQFIRIINCENLGTITNVSGSTNNKYVALGGICGVWTYDDTNFFIANCVNHGNITHFSSSNGYAGGILGYASASNCPIKNCYSDGTVSGCPDKNRGGIFGRNGSNKTTNCYYLPSTDVQRAGTYGSTAEPGNQIGDGTNQTSYSSLLVSLNNWVTTNQNTTWPYNSWQSSSNGPALIGLPSVE